jgi:MFS family permease
VTFYAAELIGAPIFGALSDRFGRKFFMVLGPIFGGVAIQLLGFTAVIPVLALVRILEGLSTASSAPATLGFISAQTANSERLRGRIMGFYEAATVVGLASGAAIAGQLYDRYATFAFTLVALIYGLALGLFMFVRDRGSARSNTATHHRGILKRMFNRRIMRFAPAWLAANAVLGVWLNVAPFLAAGAPDPDQWLMQQYSAGTIGTAFLVFGVLFTTGAITWGFVMPLIGRQATLMWGVSGLAFSSLMLYLLNQASPDRPAWVVTILTLLVALGIFVESGFTPAALAYLAEIAEERPEDRGSVMGIYSVLLSVGQLAGTALAGPFADRLGWPFEDRWGMNGIILLTGLLCLVAAFTVILLGYAERRQSARQAQSRASG